MQSNHPEAFEATGVRVRDRGLAVFIGILLIGLVALSISIRTRQARRILHGPSRTTTTMTKSDVPAPPLSDLDPMPQQFVRVLTPRSSNAARFVARSMAADAPYTQILWHSISAQHRPPPDFPS